MKFEERHINYDSSQNLQIKSAHYIGDYAIRLSFNDGTKKLVDFKPFLEQSSHPDVRKYFNEKEFTSFKIVDGNLDWNDFDLCFPLGDLYQNNLLHTMKTTSL